MSQYFLTRRSARDLRSIHLYSINQWGKKKADKYADNIIKVLQKTAIRPKHGELRQYRSLPFLMAPAERHFVVYKTFKKGIIIATVLHERRNIESIIHDIAPTLEAEINEIEKRINKKMKAS